MARTALTDQTPARSASLALGTLLAVGLALPGPSYAGGDHAHTGGIQTDAGNARRASFDIIHSKITTDGNVAVFHMGVAGTAVAHKPERVGELAGAGAHAYVWPTTLDPSRVGFPEGAGTLAMAVTAHPDFDDTPLYDENNDGKLGNDGAVWHSHWVVLGPGEECGPDALKVVDIPEGATPDLPKTWPGLPIMIDSPGWDPTLADDSVEVRVPFDEIGAVEDMAFDGVTAGLRVNANVHAPLLCVADVFDIASGDLSLPGTVNQ